ncbi:MAG: AAA family ATPase [Pseudomonadota bacterium]
MILEGNERGFGAELARHLLNPRDNDHVTVHAIEGFVADDLAGAFAEAEAISQATQCQKYLFSLSLNPPSDASVPVEVFEAAIAAIEAKLGLTGQPRAIVFHEKEGHRHAHCVWSRIDAERMRAINLAHYKRKLSDVSRALYLEQSWTIPEGFRDQAKRDPFNVSRQEASQAKRLKRDPKALKVLFRSCWEASDSRAAFEAALQEQGFLVARGERRGFVAVDANGKVWSLSRWCGVKPAELRARLGHEDCLPAIEVVLPRVGDLPRPQERQANPVLEQRRAALVTKQREARTALLQTQEARRVEALKAQRARLPKGLRAAFLKVTGRYEALRREAEVAAERLRQQDRAEQQALIDTHLAERRALRRDPERASTRDAFDNAASIDPRQPLVLPADDLALSRDQLVRDPARILAHLSHTKAAFSRTDVLRALAKRIDDPLTLKSAADRAMASPELIRLSGGTSPSYTTRDYRDAEAALARAADRLAGATGTSVSRHHRDAAMRDQDARMQRAFGGQLSDEQRAALDHILDGRQLASVVGLAGAGKSTLLATAKDAWQRAGITVHGAALAGKAADGLESASGIESRTLASLEASWENGYEPIAKSDVLVVDEAGMIGTRQLARITAKLEAIGAKLVLVGDPDQLQPIEAGTPFRHLVERHGAAELTEIHRQRDDWQKRASRDLARGEIATAVEAYAVRGAVTEGADAFDALVETYAMDAAAGGASTSRLAFAHRRADVHALNQAIRAALRGNDADGSGTLLQTDTGPRAFAAGDRIVFSRNDRDLGLKNGMLGTVRQVSPFHLVVDLDGEPRRRVTVDPHQYRSLDHGYAVTIHKSQGATVDQAYVLASRSMDRHLAYVAMTRHRAAMRLFVRNDDRPRWVQDRGREGFARDPPQRSGPSMG